MQGSQETVQAQPSKSTIGNNEEMSSLSPVFMQTQNQIVNGDNNNFSLSKTIDNDETMFDPDEGQQSPNIQNRRRNYEKTDLSEQDTTRLVTLSSGLDNDHDDTFSMRDMVQAIPKSTKKRKGLGNNILFFRIQFRTVHNVCAIYFIFATLNRIYL